MPQLVIRIDSYSALGEHSEIDILFKRTEKFGLALLRHGNLERADTFDVSSDNHARCPRSGVLIFFVVGIDANIMDTTVFVFEGVYC